MDTVTVVVPTRNRRPVLAQTLRSILSQQEVDVRVVVVDEGSTDDTPVFLASCDERVSVVRHDEPKGLPAARNAGLERVASRWVAFCDDDDLFAPTKLALQLAALRADGGRWSCTGVVSIDPELRIIGAHRPPASGDIGPMMINGNVVPGGGSGVLAETALVRELGGFDAWPTGSEDYDMWVRLSLASPVATVDRPLLGYLVWPNSMSTNVERMRTGHRRVVERYGRDPRSPEARLADLRYAQYSARFPLKAGRRWDAFRDYLSIAVDFRDPRHVGHAVWALMAPQQAERWRARQERSEVAGEWEQEARDWLQAFVTAPAATA